MAYLRKFISCSWVNKDNFTGFIILHWCYFFHSAFKIFHWTVLLLHGFWHKVHNNSYSCYCSGNAPYPTASFEMYCWSFIFFSLKMICLGVYFLLFILLWVCWVSWIYVLISVINFQKFSAIITIHIISFSVLLFFSFTYPHRMYAIPFETIPLFLVLGYSVQNSTLYFLPEIPFAKFQFYLPAHKFLPYLFPVYW